MKDQTDEKGGVMVATIGAGTGIFLIRLPDGSGHKVLTQLDSHEDFRLLADNLEMVACKWVPEQVMAYQLLSLAPCAGVACVDRCVHPGCICDPESNTCV